MESLINRMPDLLSAIASSPVALTIAKVSLILGVTLVVAQLTKRRAASVRHRVLALGLVGAFAVPLVGAIVPVWTLAVLPAERMTVDQIAFEAPVLALPIALEPSAQLAEVASVAEPAVASTPAHLSISASAPVEVASTAAIAHVSAIAPEPTVAVAQIAAIAPIVPIAIAPPSAIASTVSDAAATSLFDGVRWLATALVAVWCIGAVIAFAPWIIGVRYRRQLARSATDNLSTAWTVSIESLRRANRLSPRVRVLSSSEIDTPMTWGTISPVILVPQHSNWDSLQRRAALLHEIAHVERHDAAVQFLTRLACALHWYNPLVWMVARREQLAREQSCDDSVLSSGIAASRYAEQLMQFTQFMTSELLTNRARAAIMPMATSSSAATRLRAILDSNRSRKSLSTATKSVMTLLALGASAAIAGATPVRASETPFASAVAAPSTDVNAIATDERPVAARAIDVAPTLESAVQRTAEEAAPVADALDVVNQSRAALAESAFAPVVAPATSNAIATATAPASGNAVASVAPAPADMPSLQSLDYRRLIGAVAEGTPRPITSVPAPAPSVAQSLCVYTGSGSRSTNISTGSDGSRSVIIKWSSKRCDVEFSLRGSFVLNEAGNDIASFPNGGSLKLREEMNSHEREARLSSSSSSGVKREYWDDGDKKTWDSNASSWFSSALVSLDRDVGFLAEQRVPALLKQGGPGAVLDEIGRMTGDGARHAYATRLIKANVLTAAQVEDLVVNVASKISSDYGKAELLIAVAGIPNTNQRTQFLVATEANRIGSDYEHRRALMALLNRKDLTADAYRAIIESSRTIGSDYELAELIIAIIKTTVSNPDVNTNASIILPRASRMGSDYEKRRAMQAVLTWTLNEQAMTQLLDASTSIGSDYEHAELLMAVLKSGPITGTAREAFLKSSNAIGSDHERSRVQAKALVNLKVF